MMMVLVMVAVVELLKSGCTTVHMCLMTQVNAL